MYKGSKTTTPTTITRPTETRRTQTFWSPYRVLFSISKKQNKKVSPFITCWLAFLNFLDGAFHTFSSAHILSPLPQQRVSIGEPVKKFSSSSLFHQRIEVHSKRIYHLQSETSLWESQKCFFFFENQINLWYYTRVIIIGWKWNWNWFI